MRTDFLKWLAALSLCAVSLSAWAQESPIAVDQRRGIEQTFLTFPEWYLVHSPAEYASFVAHDPSHDFPFLGHVQQLWSSYASVTEEQLRAHYDVNPGYHVMIWVIASSTTVEYAIRWAYENTLGRISWALSSHQLSAEDKYAATVAQDYVDFIRKEPWYLYDFPAKLKGLWSSVPAWGPDMVRKWERRYALTTEYSIKAIYAKIIEFATRQTYDPALLTTQVVAVHPPENLPTNIKLIQRLGNDYAVLEMPRYFEFRIAATRLAEMNCKLVDIAGNTSVILVSAWIENKQNTNANGIRVLFEQPLITMPGYKRVAMVMPVSRLSDFLLSAGQRGWKVEHVYDY